jgi:hypothetical protein
MLTYGLIVNANFGRNSSNANGVMQKFLILCSEQSAVSSNGSLKIVNYFVVIVPIEVIAYFICCFISVRQLNICVFFKFIFFIGRVLH